MKILVVGGAGYIGSHMVKLLARNGHAVVTFDDLSSGRRSAVTAGDFVEGTLADRRAVETLLATGGFDAVMHFASFIEVGESVRDPAKYYRNNVANTQNLLDAMVEFGVDTFVFSSTAAVYGEPLTSPIDETHPTAPLNPYGWSKHMVERMLEDYGHAYGLKSVRLRYFNAAGADPDGEIGECHEPESHLIPLVLRAASGRRDCIDVYGDDYDTPDGTCIRDYVHVMDLCEAHLLALHHMAMTGEGGAFNLGNGNGYSVREVLETAAVVTGCDIPVAYAPRRPGDAARLVADATRAREVLGWTPRHDDLATIVAHAWQWERKLAVEG